MKPPLLPGRDVEMTGDARCSVGVQAVNEGPKDEAWHDGIITLTLLQAQR